MTRSVSALALAAALALPAGLATAQSQGDMTFGIGIGYVSPESDNGTLAGAAATIGDNARPIFTFEYFLRDNLGLEVLAATPFQHSIALNGTKTARTKHLPPTISLNYHFTNASAWTPYVGLGLNWTTFFDETINGGGDLDIEDSFGLAAQIGLDYALSDRSALRLNVRYIEIESDVSLNGADIGTTTINPTVFGVTYVTKF
jgi:outer membrane protein